jgi:vitellogenic carboxypeptidase-like protein
LPIPLAGLAVGNGLTDPISQIKTHTPQALALGLIGEETGKEMDRLAAISVDYICRQDWKAALDARESLFSIFQNASGNINVYDVRQGNHDYKRSPMYKLLNDAKTKVALNVGEDAVYGKDWFLFPPIEEDIMKSAVDYFPSLLEAGYKVLLYQGQYDFRDGILSQNEWIKSLSWTHQDEYLKSRREPWFIKEDLAGYVTAFQNLIRVEVLNCGHLCPGDINTTSAMIEEFLLSPTQ